jgi:phage baseplate assembly protein W
MAVTLTSDIQTPYWQLSIDEQGAVVEGIDYLVQQVLIALSTNKGSVPFDPEFGFNVSELIDKPTNFVIPNGKVGILDTLNKDVPQVKVEYIRHQVLELSNVVFDVYCSSNLGNFVVNVPVNQNYASPTVGGAFSSGFSSGFLI